MKCPKCQSPRLARRGVRRTKHEAKQLYACRDCGRRFADSTLVNKTHAPKIIAAAISTYNLGATLEKTASTIRRRFKTKVSTSSVSRWLEETRAFCTYWKLRQPTGKDSAPLITKKIFIHQGLAYNFKFHAGKLATLAQNPKFGTLVTYFEKFHEGLPDYFDSLPNRCSRTPIAVDAPKRTSYSNARRLAEIAVDACVRNTERHGIVEDFMLINDSSTIAVEVPVWLYEKSVRASINSHIDVLRVRRGLLYLLDFKPNAREENPAKVMAQLYWYALGLSFRTRIQVEKEFDSFIGHDVRASLSLRFSRIPLPRRGTACV